MYRSMKGNGSMQASGANRPRWLISPSIIISVARANGILVPPDPDIIGALGAVLAVSHGGAMA